jgi:hypothetical protein
LLNIRQVTCSGSTNSTEETIYLRLSAKEFNRLRNNRKKIVIGVATGAGISALSLFALILLVVVWRNKRKSSGCILDGVQGCNGITAFRYNDLQHATNKFKHKLGGGSFGSVFKGLIEGELQRGTRVPPPPIPPADTCPGPMFFPLYTSCISQCIGAASDMYISVLLNAGPTATSSYETLLSSPATCGNYSPFSIALLVNAGEPVREGNPRWWS